jgi:hypothetical protein
MRRLLFGIAAAEVHAANRAAASRHFSLGKPAPPAPVRAVPRVPPPRGRGKPSSTDAGFNLDSFISSSDDDPAEVTKRVVHSASNKRGGRTLASDDHASADEYSGGSSQPTRSEHAHRPRRRLPDADVDARPAFPAIVDSDGDAIPIHSEDERSLPFLPPGAKL